MAQMASQPTPPDPRPDTVSYGLRDVGDMSMNMSMNDDHLSMQDDSSGGDRDNQFEDDNELLLTSFGEDELMDTNLGTDFLGLFAPSPTPGPGGGGGGGGGDGEWM